MIPEYVYAVERTSYDINIIVAGCRNKIPFIIAFFKHVPVFGNIESDIPFQSFRTYKVGLYLKFYTLIHDSVSITPLLFKTRVISR